MTTLTDHDTSACAADQERASDAAQADQLVYDLLNSVAAARRKAAPGAKRYAALDRALRGLQAANLDLHCAAYELKNMPQ